MSTENWKEVLFDLALLRTAAQHSRWGVSHSVFGFLKDIGVVPEDVYSAPVENVKTNFRPDRVPAGYLASAAYEWDTWGPSHPEDFIDAIADELNPQKREYIVSLLTALGRTVQ